MIDALNVPWEERELNMRNDRRPDFETLSLFLILGILTALLVWGSRWVLFVPASPFQPTAPVTSSRP